uniref:lipopolysaccharide biosynthesis protein n=2 Tax=Neorhizobium sp. SOG26 TaxID=2060726 RepID=UPI0012372958|nr:lipopolysaccharide biosynthesis protein [Neorhizobium sp. SOG26]
MKLMPKRDFRRLIGPVSSYLGSSSALLASSLAVLFTFALLARHLGHEQFALNATITALTNLGVQICGLGSQEALVRRVAQDRSCYPRLLGHVHILNLTTGAALFVIGMILIPWMFPISADLGVTLLATALILFTNIILLKIVWLATNSYIAHGRFAVANRIEFIFAGLRMAAAAVACLVVNITTVAEWAIWNFAAHAVAAVLSLAAIRRLGRPRFGLLREELSIGVMFASQFFFKAGRNNADILVLSAVAGSELVGSYSIARRLTEASYMSVDALNRILYPGYAAAALNGVSRVCAHAKRMLSVTGGIAITAAFFVWAISSFLPLLFGAEYISLPLLAQLMCWTVVPIAVAAAAFEALGAAGLQRIRARIVNLSNLIGTALVAAAAFLIGLSGMIVVTYLLEIIIAVLAWRALTQAASASVAGGSVKVDPAESTTDTKAA